MDLLNDLNIPPPKTNEQEVLYELITCGNASIDTFGYMCGFRTRISEIKERYRLPLISHPCRKQNKYGNYYTYHIHFLRKKDFELAKNIYKKMQENGKK